MGQSTALVRALQMLGTIVIAGSLCQFAACGDSPDAPAPIGAAPVADPDAGASGAPSVPSEDSGTATVPPEPPVGSTDAGAPLTCQPGETAECSLDLLCTGTATCAADGQGFGACDCGSVAAAVIGASCESDSDCAGGAHCMAAASNEYLGRGGPAGGYCTFSCTDSTECTQHDPSSVCSPIGADGTSFCVRTCLSKDAEPGEGKCLNRPDVACLSVVVAGIELFTAERQLGFCAPRCGSDEDCPAGRQCHSQGGICTTFAAPGLPVGSPCSLTTDCQGQACEDEVDGVGTCTQQCVLGSLSGCGYGRDPESRDAACVTAAIQQGRFGEGPGDIGLCLGLCDADEDCQQVNPAAVCRPLNDDLAGFFGRSGACVRGS
jgi:hypothetical protein